MLCDLSDYFLLFLFFFRSQRSKECPICWQLLALKDPAWYVTSLSTFAHNCCVLFCFCHSLVYLCSQELLTAVERERRSRSRISTVASPTIHYFRDDYDVEHVRAYLIFFMHY